MTVKDKSHRGGKRPGAGRKPLDAASPSVVFQVRISSALREAINDCGGSPWARKVLENAAVPKQTSIPIAAELPETAIPLVIHSRMNLPLAFAGVQAGFPSPAESYQEDPVDLNDLLVSNEAATFLIYAKGDSMVDAGINHGDLLIVDRSLEGKPGDIVIMQINNADFTVKRLMRTPEGTLYLHPENSSGLFKDIYPVSGEEWRQFGVVTHIVKNTAARQHF